jgi:hypothetical protein
MKKNINSYEELLFSLAQSGDSAAFHSLIEPLLRNHYVKMISEGMQHEEVCEKLCEKAVSLYKAFLVSGKSALSALSDSEFEKINEPSGETDFLQSDVVNRGEQQFSRELMHCLQQFRRRYKGKFRHVRRRSQGFTFSKRTLLVIISILAVITGFLLYSLVFSSASINVKIVKKPNKSLNGSLKIKQDTLVKHVDVSMVHDTVKKDTLKDTVRKVDSLPKPKPKPKPKPRSIVTENPQPIGSAEILNAFEASPVAQPASNKEQPSQVQPPAATGSALPQTGSPVIPQPSIPPQDSSSGY